MKTLASLFCITIVLFTLSCQRPLEEEELMYLGNWSSKTYALQINSNGYGVCNTKKWGGLTCQGYVTINGRRMVFTSNSEHSTLARKRFTIDQTPQIDTNGETFMILNGERFVKH